MSEANDLDGVAYRFEALLDREFVDTHLGDFASLAAALMRSAHHAARVERGSFPSLDVGVADRVASANSRYENFVAGRANRPLSRVEQWRKDCEHDPGARRRWRDAFG